MKILFASMPVDLTNDFDFISMRTVPNTALYLLSAIILNRGYDVTVLDPSTIKKILNEKTLQSLISSYFCGYEIICLSSNTLNWASTAYAINEIRSYILHISISIY